MFIHQLYHYFICYFVYQSLQLYFVWDGGYYDGKRVQVVVIKLYYVIRIISDDQQAATGADVNVVADASKRDDVGDNNSDSNKSCMMCKTPRVFSALNSSGISNIKT